MFHHEAFPGQQPDEKVMTVLHRHWFVFIRQSVIILLAAGVPFLVGVYWLPLMGWKLESDSLGYILLVLFGGAYYLFLWILLFGYWLDYYLDFFVVSDKRVVDIEQAGLFHRTVAEQRLFRIQDVTHEIKGFFPTMLKYGNVYIQTAGEKERFVFEQVPNPEAVAKLILALSDKQNPLPTEAKPGL